MIEPMIRRLAALVLVALLFASNFAAVDCAGWQPSARERMACCIKADHGVLINWQPISAAQPASCPNSSR
jgi:hypothetical protein